MRKLNSDGNIAMVIEMLVTWYPTVVAIVRIITTNVIAAWLAIVELLSIVMRIMPMEIIE